MTSNTYDWRLEADGHDSDDIEKAHFHLIVYLLILMIAHLIACIE